MKHMISAITNNHVSCCTDHRSEAATTLQLHVMQVLLIKQVSTCCLWWPHDGAIAPPLTPHCSCNLHTEVVWACWLIVVLGLWGSWGSVGGAEYQWCNFCAEASLSPVFELCLIESPLRACVHHPSEKMSTSCVKSGAVVKTCWPMTPGEPKQKFVLNVKKFCEGVTSCSPDDIMLM